MNFEVLDRNLLKAREGASNAKVEIKFHEALPQGQKISDGKGRGVPLPIGKQRVAVVGIKEILSKSGDYDFFLLTVADEAGVLYDVSVDGEYITPSVDPKFTVECDCIHNEKGYAVVTFIKGSSKPILRAVSNSAEVPF